MSQEIRKELLHTDVRTSGQKLKDFFSNMNNLRAALIICVVLMVITPGLFIFWFILSVVFFIFLVDLRVELPLRYPKDSNYIDPSDYYTEQEEYNYFLFKGMRKKIKYAKAGGILFWGIRRSKKNPVLHGQELWSTNSDCRTHAFLAGTTGSGKSESLYGIVYNALSWGSGAIYADGKADISLPFTIWSLCRKLGREDDFLHLNLLTGGRDIYENLVEEEQARKEGREYYSIQKKGTARSNTSNPFSGGTADFQLQLLVSLLPKADGSSAQWQEKAINLADALIRCLRYKHLRGDLTMSILEIRKHLALDELVKLHKEGKEGKLPHDAVFPITSYLQTGLSFNFDLIDQPQKWAEEVRTQHGYLTSQFARTLAMMTDSYGFVYSVSYPEIDMSDVLLNNRVLVISIPSMEKSAQEAEALGKLAISSIKLMMAENLGSSYEGTAQEILKTRATSSPHPYIIITDELAYYYASGLAVMYAQARSLGFMMIAAVQDIQGLKRGSAGEETESLLANTKFKYCLALEDTKDTYELIKNAAGDGYFASLSGFDYDEQSISTAWNAGTNAKIESRNRLQINDLKQLNSGEGFIVFKDQLVEIAAFYIPDHLKHTKLEPRVNRFIEIEHPKSLSKVIGLLEVSISSSSSVVDKISTELNLPILNDPIAEIISKQSDEVYLNAIAALDSSLSNERQKTLYHHIKDI